jgi:hypothetical protein
MKIATMRSTLCPLSIMNTPSKTKMCWNCEGNVLLTEEFCPYCRVAVDGQPSSSPAAESPLYPPLYSTAPVATVPTSPPPFMTVQPAASPGLINTAHTVASQLPIDDEDEAADDNTFTVVTTMAMLMGGIILLLFAIALYFFGHDGYLELRWSDRYWFFYLLAAIPMLYVGISNLGNVEQ